MQYDVAAGKEPGFDMADWATQLRKGLLEMVVLAAIHKGDEAYGYQIVEALSLLPGLEISESTVYPLLSRLTKDKMLSVRDAPSPAGPPRRYYRLTSLGSRRLVEMNHTWNLVSKSVAQVIEGGKS